jgi:adenylyltransferase/sulfurtransferase
MTPLAGSADLRRYSRHLLVPEVGLAGQQRLANARVLCVGAGGLGSPVIAYLAAAGVGRLGIVDDDAVDLTNLQRQVLYATADVGASKAHTAAARARALNPQIAVDAYPIRLDAGNARTLIAAYDIVVDATDTFGARYLINDAAFLEGKPDVAGSIFQFDGQLSIFGASGGPCYRCLYPVAPPAHLVPTCADGGVLGTLAGIVGTWQASEVLKLIVGVGESLAGRLMLIDARDARVREVRLERDPACILCGASPAPAELGAAYGDERPPSTIPGIRAAELDALLESAPALVLDVREPHERVLGAPPGSVAIPARELEARLHELDSARTYVVACRVGHVSTWAAERLRDAGFGRVYHLDGGLLAYAAHTEAFDAF